MMNLQSVKKTASTIAKTFTRHLPGILSATACGGVVLTGYFAARDGQKAKEIFKSEKSPEGKISGKCVVDTAKVLAPTVITGAGTIACIVASHEIHLDRYHALMVAYNSLAYRYNEFQEETEKYLGKAGKAAVAGAVAKKYATADIYEDEDSKDTNGETEHWFFDDFSQNWFKSTWKNIYEANLHLQDQYQIEGVGHLNSYYKDLGLNLSKGKSSPDIVWDYRYMCDQMENNFIPFDYYDIDFENGKTGVGISFPINPLPFDENGNYEIAYNLIMDIVTWDQMHQTFGGYGGHFDADKNGFPPIEE